MHPEGVDAIFARAQSMDRTILTEFESKQILAAYGIQTVKTTLARNGEEAVCAADEIGYPVVVKINSETMTHKTDVGTSWSQMRSFIFRQRLCSYASISPSLLV